MSPPAGKTPSGSLGSRLALIGGCLISLVALWSVGRTVDWPSFFAALRRFNLLWLVPGLAAFYFSMYLRGVRWALLFRPHHRIKSRRAFGPLMIGFAFNSILPARVGEFVRCFAINKSESTGVAKAVATVVAERILDGLTMLGLLVLSLRHVTIDPKISIQWNGHTLDSTTIVKGEHALVAFSIVLIVGVLLTLLPPVQRLILEVIEGITILPQAWRKKISGLFMEFSLGFHALKNPLTLVRILAYSLVLWVLIGVSNIAIARGFGMPMNLWQANAIVTLICFAIMIPAAPGYWGLYEAGTTFALLVLGIESDPSRALAYGLMIHMVQWAPVVVIGLFYASRAKIKPGVAALPDGQGAD